MQRGRRGRRGPSATRARLAPFCDSRYKRKHNPRGLAERGARRRGGSVGTTGLDREPRRCLHWPRLTQRKTHRHSAHGAHGASPNHSPRPSGAGCAGCAGSLACYVMRPPAFPPSRAEPHRAAAVLASLFPVSAVRAGWRLARRQDPFIGSARLADLSSSSPKPKPCGRAARTEPRPGPRRLGLPPSRRATPRAATPRSGGASTN